MRENAILLISRDHFRAESLAGDLERWCGTRVERVAEVPDALDPCGLDGYGLAVYWLGRAGAPESLAEVLKTVSYSRRRVPVVALAERYDEAQALTCFRLGVTDYLSLHDHREVLGQVVNVLLAGSSPAATIDAERPVRFWKSARFRPALKG